jgi:hypothetical protein
MKFIRAKTISGPKNPMAACGPDPKNHNFYGLLRLISQLRNKKGSIAIINRLHFPTRRFKVRIHIGFQVLLAAAFYANLRPDPALLLILAGRGWLLVCLDLWFSLHFIVSGCVCKLCKSISWQGKCAHKMKVYWTKTGFLQGIRCFDKEYVKAVLSKWTDHFRGFGSSRL